MSLQLAAASYIYIHYALKKKSGPAVRRVRKGTTNGQIWKYWSQPLAAGEGREGGNM